MNRLDDENNRSTLSGLENLEIRANYDKRSNDRIDNYAFPRNYVSSDEAKGRINLMQDSLFPNLCSTIYFGVSDEKIFVPPEIKPCLHWRLSLITPNLIRETVVHSGFKLIKEKNSERKKWIATWCKHMKSYQFELLKENQKVNHFPGCFQLGRKDSLSWNIRNFTPLQSNDYFHPNTYILPHDLALLRKRWIYDELPSKLLILKPPASARAVGVTVINKWTQIPKKAKVVAKNRTTRPVVVAQEYIADPCLLFNGTKFDLRVYALVTSFYPLRVYVYDDGLVRFASEPYSLDDDALSNLFIHVTNYCINKLNQSYKPNDSVSSRTGHKWSLNTLWKYLRENYPGVNVDNLWEQILEIVIKTLISVQDSIDTLVTRHLKTPYNGYELLGFDIMLDSNFKPWLLEVNISPSLKSESKLDIAVKGQLIKDMLNTVGYRPPKCYNNKTIAGKCNFCSSNTSQVITEDPGKSRMFKDIKDFDLKILDNLTSTDIYHLTVSEDELSRSGRFTRIFPTHQSHKYFSYFRKNSYFDHLLNAWEKKYAHQRLEGIKLLRKMVYEKFIYSENV